MAIVAGTALESNKNFRVNFDGGNLSSDGGLLLLQEFYHKFGVKELLRKQFRTTDSASFRIHKDHENLLQMLYQITGAYFQDDHADMLLWGNLLWPLSLPCLVSTTVWTNRACYSWKPFRGLFARELTPLRSRSTFCSTWILHCWPPTAHRRVKRSTTTIRLTDTIRYFASTA